MHRRANVRLAAGGAALAAAVLAAIVIAAQSGGGPGLPTFNACIGHKRFLVTSERTSAHREVETISDRARRVTVGVFAVLPSVRAVGAFKNPIMTPAGTGEANGRMILFTRVATGRDTQAILTCAAPEFPGP